MAVLTRCEPVTRVSRVSQPIQKLRRKLPSLSYVYIGKKSFPVMCHFRLNYFYIFFDNFLNADTVFLPCIGHRM